MFLSMKPFDECSQLALSLFLCILLSAGCVKENREDCPCRLIVDLSDVDTSRISSVDVILSGSDGFVYQGHRSAESYPEDKVIFIPGTDVFMNVCYGDRGMMTSEGLRIPEGKDCPPVYMCSALIEASGREFVRKSVNMCKNHCVMTIFVEDTGDDSLSDMVVKGNVCGYDCVGNPLAGSFSCNPEVLDESSYMLVLPRQTDASLVLEVRDGSDVLKTFALGEYIKACGYDWVERDLKDMTVCIDYARTLISISVRGWDEVYEFDIVI